MTYPQKITLSSRKLKKTFLVKNQVRAAPGPHSVLSAARTVRLCMAMCNKGLEALIVTKSPFNSFALQVAPSQTSVAKMVIPLLYLYVHTSTFFRVGMIRR